ncbi:tetratricopeptide repeat protein, partial [bacterium]|nr:tetratricopeptide repeat protein [bacterium]
MTMRIPARLHSEWLALRVVDGPLLLRAQQLHEREDYARSSALLAPYFADGVPEAAAHGARPLVDAVALHAWNLLQSNQTEALVALLQRVDAETLAACPDLAVADLFLRVREGDLVAARAGAEHHIDLQREAMGRHTSRFLYVLALVDSKSGDAEAAVAHLESAHAICTVTRDEFWSAMICNYLGFVLVQQSRYRDAMVWLERSLEAFRRRELPRKQSLVHLHLGIAQYKRGDLAAARGHLEDSLRLARAGAWQHNQCFANIALGNVHRLQRDFESARRRLHTAYSQAQELGYPREEALALEFLGDVYRDEGQTEAARRFYARS